MITIYKYTLTNSMRLPSGSTPLSVGLQDGIMCLWALVNTNNRPEDVSFTIVGTGWDLKDYPHLVSSKFIGTIQQPPFVWHVFEDFA